MSQNGSTRPAGPAHPRNSRANAIATVTTYWQLTLVCHDAAVSGVTQHLRSLGTLGVLAQPLDDERTSLAALFEATHDRQALLRSVHEHVEHDGVLVSGRIRAVPVTGDWAEAWPEYFVPVEVGRRL